MRPVTLVEALQQKASLPDEVQLSDFPVVYLEDGVESRETFRDIYHGAREYLAAFHQIGLEKGDYVVLQTPTRAKHFRAFWGCALGGIIPVNVAVPVDFAEDSSLVGKMRGVLDTLLDVRRCSVLTEDSVFDQLSSCLRQGDTQDLGVYSVDSLVSRYRGAPCVEAEVDPSDILFLQLTSGSTGIPKCIQESHEGVICQILSSAGVCGYAYGKTTLNWLPFDHVVPMLTCHLRDVFIGMGQVQIPTQEVLANPLLWIDSLEKYKVNFSWSPNFGYNIVTEACNKLHGNKTWNLKSLEFLLNAGEQVTRSVCDEFIHKVGIQARVMQPSFGMAESCTCITYCTNYSSSSVFRASKASVNSVLFEAAPEEPAVEFMDLGPVIEGVEIRITGSDRVTAVSECVVGHFQIKGPVVTQGYVNRPESNKEAFVGGGWFDSGDLGFMLGGRLYLTGRHKESINIRGANLYCYEIEQQVEQVAGVLSTFAAATSLFNNLKGTEDLLIFFSPDDAIIDTTCLSSYDRLDDGMLALVSQVQRRVTRSTGIAPRHCIPVLSSNFHKTTSGKIQRIKFRTLFEQSHFDRHFQEVQIVPGLLRSGCFEHQWAVFKPRESDRILRQLRIKVLKLVCDSPLAQKVEQVLQHAGHSILDQQPDIVLCSLCVPYASDDVAVEAENAIQIFDCIVAALKCTPPNSRFWMIMSDIQGPIGEAVKGFVRTITSEYPFRKPSILFCDSTTAAMQNVPVVLENPEFDTAREIMLRGEDILLASLVPKQIPLAGTLELNGEATYLITGGTGALGLELTRYLVEVGARHIVLFSRKGESNMVTNFLAPMRENGAEVVTLSGDLRKKSDVVKLLQEVCLMPGPLKGVFHLAGVYESCKSDECTVDLYDRVFRAKAGGAALLHEGLAGASLDLDHFVFFSSVASSIGPIGHAAYAAAYAAANAFLDGLADLRRSQGSAALSIQWGPWAHSQGMAGEDEFQLFKKIGVQEGLTCLGLMMRANAPTGLVLNKFDFTAYSLNSVEDQEFVIPHLLNEQVRLATDALKFTGKPEHSFHQSVLVLKEIIQDILGTEPTLGDDLFLLGLDSTGAMRLIGSIQRRLKIRVPINFAVKYPTLKLMESYLRRSLVYVDAITSPVESSDMIFQGPEAKDKSVRLESSSFDMAPFPIMHPRIVFLEAVHHDGCVPSCVNSVSASDFSKLISFIGMRRILGARDFFQRAREGSLLPPHLCIMISHDLSLQSEVALALFKRHGIEALWLTLEARAMAEDCLSNISAAGHMVSRCIDPVNFLGHDAMSDSWDRNAVISVTNQNEQGGFKFCFLHTEDENTRRAFSGGEIQFPILHHSAVQLPLRRGEQLFEYPRGGQRVSGESGNLEWYHPAKHSIFQDSLKKFFGAHHPLCLDRDLFDWQYKGGSHIVLSATPSAVLGYIPCKFVHANLGLHDGAQMAMFYVSDEEKGNMRSAMAIGALQAPFQFVGQGKLWSSLVVMAQRETAFPLVKLFGFTGVDPMRRHIKYIQPNHEKHLIQPWAEADTRLLAMHWGRLQDEHPVTAVHRDAEFWAWRYLNTPQGRHGGHQYKFFKIPGVPLEKSGLVVARIQHHALRIVELLPPSWTALDSSSFTRLINGVLAWGSVNGCDVVDFWCTHNGLGGALSERGWYNQFDSQAPEQIALTPQIFTEDKTGRDAPPINMALITAVGSRDNFKILTADTASWYFVKSDGDMDRPPSNILPLQM